MAKFLADTEISDSLIGMITDAKNHIVLISPYLKIAMPVFDALCKSADKKVRIRLLYKDGKMDANARQLLGKISNLETYTLANLHSKCYYNEKTMIITSMNLYEKSTSPNREMGILIERDADSIAFTNALNECRSMLDNSKKIPLEGRPAKTSFDNKMQLAVFNSNILSERKGHCIRCNGSIDYNLKKPFCYDCYSVWDEFGNVYYEEDHCHSCGNISDTSMAKPECLECFRNNNEKAKIG